MSNLKNYESLTCSQQKFDVIRRVLTLDNCCCFPRFLLWTNSCWGLELLHGLFGLRHQPWRKKALEVQIVLSPHLDFWSHSNNCLCIYFHSSRASCWAFSMIWRPPWPFWGPTEAAVLYSPSLYMWCCGLGSRPAFLKPFSGLSMPLSSVNSRLIIRYCDDISIDIAFR